MLIKKRKVFKNPKSGVIFIFICIFLCFHFLCSKTKVWPQQNTHIRPFRAALKIERTDCAPQEGTINSTELVFGFAETESALIAPPQPPMSCIRAFFDQNSNHTGFIYKAEGLKTAIEDLNEKLAPQRGFWDGWQEVLLPLPGLEPSYDWKANWGFRMFYPNTQPNQSETVSIIISWDQDKLIPGPFYLYISDKKIDMHEYSQIQIDNIEEGSIFNIEYLPIGPSKSVLGIVCVGGGSQEAYRRGRFRAFSHLGDWGFKNLKVKTCHPNTRYIFYKSFYDLNGDSTNDIYSLKTISQKETLRMSIEDWAFKKWKYTIPKEAILIIYLVDHGEYGKFFLDPLADDPNNRVLRGYELDQWLQNLEDNLAKENFSNYEIYTIIEACYSRDFFEELTHSESAKRVVIVSTMDELADVSKNGRESFSHHFWNKIGREIFPIKEIFNHVTDIMLDQNASFWPEAPHKEKGFLFDTIDPECAYPPPIFIPVIEDVKVDIIPVDSLGCRIKLTVQVDSPVNRAWASIVSPNCSDDWCRFYSNSDDSTQIDANILTFSPDYYFCHPDTEVSVYVQGYDTEVSGPYHLDPNFLETYFPDFQDPNIPVPKDDHEPDDNPEVKFIPLEEPEIHNFHDPNDVDWIVFTALPEIPYDIEILVHNPLFIDPNEFPFEVTMYMGEEEKSIEFSEDFQDYCYEDLCIDNARVYTHSLYLEKLESENENATEEGQIIKLKVIPKKEYQGILVYRVHFSPTGAEAVCHIFSAVNKITKNSIKDNSDLYLKDNFGNEFYPKWLKSNIIDKYNPCHPEYFYFKIHHELGIADQYQLYLEGTERWPVISLDKDCIKWLDPNEYLPDKAKPAKNCDSDCDGRTDEEEIIQGTNPNHPEIILNPGINLFRYPFWAYYKGIGGINLKEILFNGNLIDPNAIKIYIYSNKEKSWCFFDKSSPEIILKNKAGCIIYLDPAYLDINQSVQIIPLPNDFYPGECLRNVYKYNIPIQLYPGINLVSLIGYKSCFDSLILIGDGFFDSHSVVYSLNEKMSSTKSFGFSSINRYDRNQGKWQQNSLFFGHPSGKKFPMRFEESHLFYLNDTLNDPNTLKGISWMPYQIIPDND
ncbi:MAG: thrombospondin type 3 repeat-containing protein [bacterium]